MMGFADLEMDGWLKISGCMVLNGERGRWIKFQGTPKMLNGELLRNGGKVVYHDPMVEMRGERRLEFTAAALAAIDEYRAREGRDAA
jgi:hypothetical protein